MSIVSLTTASDVPTCTIEDLRETCKASGFSVEEGGLGEKAFSLFQNSFDAVCETVKNLPEYEDPRLAPAAVEGGERTFYRPDEKENPLNGWAHKTTLKSSDPKAANGPLAGRTIAFKDNVSVGGLPLGLGASPEHFAGGKHPISTIDATVVGRVLAAGGIVKGTATCENFSAFPLSYTSHSGVVHNAWLLGYATGGSSSGCGTLVSVGDVEDARRNGEDSRDYSLGEGVDIAVGGDQGGSIRLPASYSGIFGLKPTHGLVPYSGIAPLNPLMDHTGPMARTVEDTALLLGVMAGYDGIDPRMTPDSPTLARVPDYLGELNAWISSRKAAGEWTASAAAKGLRIGILKESFEFPGISSDVISSVKAAAARFKLLGADVKEVSVPMHSLGAAIWTISARPRMPNYIKNVPGDFVTHTLPGLDPLPIDQKFFDILSKRNPAVVNVLMNVAHLEKKYGPSLVRKAHMHVQELQAAYNLALEDCDVLLTPINPTVGPPHPTTTSKTTENPDGFTEDIMTLFEPAIGNTLNTCSFNVTGHPAMSMPIGWGKVKGSDGRLPIGMQVVGKKWDEASIFKAAKAWEVGGRWSD